VDVAERAQPVEGYSIDETYRLEWESRPGAWVQCRAMSTGEVLEISEKLAAATDENGRIDKAIMMRHAAQVLADVVLAWSFKRSVKDPETGRVWEERVPTTYTGAMMLGHKLLIDVYTGFMGESAQVEPTSPLDDGLPSGLPYPEELTAMETLSPSQPS
jgi:hypothetical protein